LIKEPYYRLFTSFDIWGNTTNRFFYNEKGLTDVSKHSIQKEKLEPVLVSICLAKDLYQLYIGGFLEYDGRENFKGKSYHVIKSNNQKQNEVYYFDEVTFLLEARRIVARPGRVDLFKDYRDTNLILHPFLFESFENEVLYYRQETVDFTFNREFDDKIFVFNEREYEEQNRPKIKYESVKLETREPDLDSFIKANFSAKRVFIDLWATWCAPCKKEFKSYDSAFYALMDKQNISLVYLSIDKDSDKKKWESDIERLGLKGYHVRANKQMVENLQRLIFDNGSITIPRYILINEDGNILSKDFLRPSDDQFGKMIESSFDN
jgi:thiol-disulfide isomerase/thioredoxin